MKKHASFTEWLNTRNPEYLAEARAGWLPTLGLAAASIFGGAGKSHAQAPPVPMPGMEEKEKEEIS